MDFNEAQQFLMSLNNVPRREYMKDTEQCEWYLKRLKFFLKILDNPQKKISHYIHVTGTSGKGSVCSFLHSILRASGQKTGSIESPHPTYMVERWKVGGRTMTDNEFIRLTEKIKTALDAYMRNTPYDMVSYSEIMTAMGFLYLAEKKVDWAVVEAGCGGRYDATNVMPYKDIAIITNIGLDHTAILGDTKEKIANEKAGIIKRGAMVFTMEKNKRIVKIFEKEARRAAAKIFKNKDLRLKIIENGSGGTKFIYGDEVFKIKAMGAHQMRNAILCVEVAWHLGISEKAVEKGLAEAEQPLRMEIARRNPLVILDGAHNPDKIKTTVDCVKLLLNNEIMPRRASGFDSGGKQWNNIHLVISFSHDKNATKMIKQLSSLNPKSIACTRNTINPFRPVADPGVLLKLCRRAMPKAATEAFLEPMDAFEWSKKQAKKDELILVTGSIFLSGELRGRLVARA